MFLITPAVSEPLESSLTFNLSSVLWNRQRGNHMSQKKISIIPLAAALASLGTPGHAAIAVKSDVAQPTDAVKAGAKCLKQMYSIRSDTT